MKRTQKHFGIESLSVRNFVQSPLRRRLGAGSGVMDRSWLSGLVETTLVAEISAKIHYVSNFNNFWKQYLINATSKCYLGNIIPFAREKDISVISIRWSVIVTNNAFIDYLARF